MNERIKKLAFQAKLRAAILLHHYGNVDALTDSEQESLKQIEKFAELIVRECAEVVEGFVLTEEVSLDESSELSMVPRKRTVWVNLYSDGEAFYHHTQKEADDLDSEAISERIGGKAHLVEIEE